MYGIVLPEALSKFIRRGALTEEAVQSARRFFLGDACGGARSPDAIEWLFVLDERCLVKTPEWQDFLAEAVAEHVFGMSGTPRRISEVAADWLLERLGRDGVVATLAAFEALLRVLETASDVPPRLAAFALAQVRRAVVEGDGPFVLPHGRPRGAVGPAETETLRRILIAGGGEGSTAAVTRAEAEVLFDLNDLASEAENHPGWSDLFVKALANHLMAARGLPVPARGHALRREKWLDGVPASDSLFASAMASHIRESLRGVFGQRGSVASGVAAQHADSAPDRDCAWFTRRIGRDGGLRENERVLLAFLREATPELRVALRQRSGSAA